MINIGYNSYSPISFGTNYRLKERDFNIHKNFELKTGKKLHIPTAKDIKISVLSMTLNNLSYAVKTGKLPKDIKHIIIAHGEGSSIEKDWRFVNGQSVFYYIKRYIDEGEKCLVISCEDSRHKIKPGIGTYVDGALINRSQPAKIVVSGKNVIVGTFTIQDGVRYYK